MAMEDFSRHQQGIIKRFYQNQEAVSLQRVAELVGDLYLAEGKKRLKIWDQVEVALAKVGLPADQIAHLRKLAARMCWPKPSRDSKPTPRPPNPSRVKKGPTENLSGGIQDLLLRQTAGAVPGWLRPVQTNQKLTGKTIPA